MNAELLCRACGHPLRLIMADLGLSPFSNAFIRPHDAHCGEMFYPLRVRVCEQCWLAQLDHISRADAHFNDDYVYFSSYSSSWLAHAACYVEAMTERFALNAASHVIEIASNDGYLLQYFVQKGIPCLGIEPSTNTAEAARARGVNSRQAFFDAQSAAQLAAEGLQADVLLGNNVLAHVPDINAFVGAMPLALKSQGVITLEFPHLLRLLAGHQFDTIYHEHYSYLSLTALMPIFARAGLRVFDVEELPTHGGSLRVYVCHVAAAHADTGAVTALLTAEDAAGLRCAGTYTAFADQVQTIKQDLLDFLIQARRAGKQVAAYGAAAKGNTLLNYCGIGTDMITCVADKNPTKQGRLLPGCRIPVCSPEAMLQTRPDYVLILPWNIKAEIEAELVSVRAWGGQCVVAIPHLSVW